MLTERLMDDEKAGANDFDDETASLKASTNQTISPRLADGDYGSTEHVPLSPQARQNAGGSPTGVPRRPSLTRRMSSNLFQQVERQQSIADNIGLTSRVNQIVPDAIRQQIPDCNVETV